MDQEPRRDTTFYLRKVNDCIRYADETTHAGLRAYWLELAHRWMQSISVQAPAESSNHDLHETTRAAGAEESSTSEGSPGDMLLPPWSEEQIAAFDDLPPHVRALAFQELALEAKRNAALTDGEQRQALINNAGFWQRLANMAEQEIAVNKVSDDSRS